MQDRGKRIRRPLSRIVLVCESVDRPDPRHGPGGDAHFDETKGQASSPPIPSPKRKKVALVDDDVLVRTVFEKVLTYNGFEVMASMSDGDEIVKSIDGMSTKPDVVIMDERMPRMSGVEACRIIHSRYPEIRIIFVSADESAKDRASDAGACGFLSKPLSTSDLIFALNSV